MSRIFGSPLPTAEITSPDVYKRRREFLFAAGTSTLLSLSGKLTEAHAAETASLGHLAKSPFSTPEKPSTREQVTQYGNFYEFGPDKDSPARNAHRLKVSPWQVIVDGEVKNPKTFALEDILKWATLEERVYRFRCVEGWSAVIPWAGFPFTELLKRIEPTGNAKYVEFWSLADPEQMPYVQIPVLDWPYLEALRLDEARHPLTLLAFGMYGETMPKQNGAPLRLIVPWKYGFKGAKSIVRIRFVEKAPQTTWMKASPGEYGFFSNVNPAVPHKRWEQRYERRLGEFFKRPTLLFNGYAEQVASLYSGMDLNKYF